MKKLILICIILNSLTTYASNDGICARLLTSVKQYRLAIFPPIRPEVKDVVRAAKSQSNNTYRHLILLDFLYSSNFKLTIDEVIYLSKNAKSNAFHDHMLIEFAKNNYQNLSGDELFKLAKATYTWPNRGEIVKFMYKLNKMNQLTTKKMN